MTSRATQELVMYGGHENKRDFCCACALKKSNSVKKTIPKLVRTRERSTASWAPLQVVVEVSNVVCGLME